VKVLIPSLVGLPLLGAGLSMALWRFVRVQQVMGVAILVGISAAAVAGLVDVASNGPTIVQVGGWGAPIGITLVADLLSMLLLAVALPTILAVLVYAIGQPRADKGAFYFHPLFLVLTAGVSAAFLTGDLFNLFVAFEMILAASYVLITLGGGPAQVRAGMTYIVINLGASTLLITAVGLIYASTGTLNMADAAQRLGDVPPELTSALSLLLLLTLGIKAAIFPLFFWLPDSYPTAPVTVTAVFAGLLTKIGVYAIIRTRTLLFPGGEGPDTFLLVVAALTMVVGVLGAIAQDDMKRILSFHIISQIGYMIFGLALNSPAGLAAAMFFTMHQIPVKTSLFLVNGIVETHTGTAALHNLGGMMRRLPLTALLFGLAALSLAGLPPFSGFFGKLALIDAGFAEEVWLVTAIGVGVSLLTLFSMTKIWAGVFWGEAPEETPIDRSPFEPPTRTPLLMIGATVGLVALTVGIGIWAEPLYDLARRAAVDLANGAPSYVEAVLQR
jgi:multicomponent Na+:H+ antiporter subunit D